MSTLSVDTIQGKTTAGTIAMPSGSVVQQTSREVANNSFSLSTGNSWTDVTNFYVDITPKFNDSIIMFDTKLNCSLNDETAYAQIRVVDSNNSDTVIHSGTEVAQAHYYNSMTGSWFEIPITARDASCGTTSTMRLQLQVQLGNNGDNAHTFVINWSNNSYRTLIATEIKA